ncbi:MAG: 23S rRNA (uracil(747)-C(5))-methyltransferase [Actinomyces sp.]|uniref:23S rRNA (uracil(747)-C(5))-methyltransferase n=1 Tax=Actinomyces sp. TaxID=29317 RepID=UPI0026DC2069|nr:23S rRNA (uracil(747)-C(5))-methyltransferase [Actinomyces sp.]MDO4244005.1 23S rRNA (uracil(747)-C(5))-methyltransferase [Actinomyces sp.]
MPPAPPPVRCPRHESGACHSCPHLATPLPLQLAAKQERVAALLASGPNPVPGRTWLEPAASAPTRFRNKAKMVVSGTAHRPVLGILDAEMRGVDLRACPLHEPLIEQALPVIAELIGDLGLEPYDVPARRGELKHVLVTVSPDGDLMVRFVLRSRRHLETLRRALPALRRRLETLAVLSVNIQPVHQAVIEGAEEIVLTDGPDGHSLLMRLRLPGDLEPLALGPQALGPPAPGEPAPGEPASRELLLSLPVRSFFQTNTAVAAALYATARRWADDLPPGPFPAGATTPPEARRDGARAPRGAPEEVWDLFCGVGGFALALAAPGRRVRGVEVSAEAVDGARHSAARMGLGAEVVRFETGDARVLDPGAPGALPDLLVVNPPRSGIGTDLAGRIERCGLGRVLYSSCNPATLRRDLAAMPSLRVRRARLFDMFPHTDHAEVLVELVRGTDPASRGTR